MACEGRPRGSTRVVADVVELWRSFRAVLLAGEDAADVDAAGARPSDLPDR